MVKNPTGSASKIISGPYPTQPCHGPHPGPACHHLLSRLPAPILPPQSIPTHSQRDPVHTCQVKALLGSQHSFLRFHPNPCQGQNLLRGSQSSTLSLAHPTPGVGTNHPAQSLCNACSLCWKACPHHAALLIPSFQFKAPSPVTPPLSSRSHSSVFIHGLHHASWWLLF